MACQMPCQSFKCSPAERTMSCRVSGSATRQPFICVSGLQTSKLLRAWSLAMKQAIERTRLTENYNVVIKVPTQGYSRNDFSDYRQISKGILRSPFQMASNRAWQLLAVSSGSKQTYCGPEKILNLLWENVVILCTSWAKKWVLVGPARYHAIKEKVVFYQGNVGVGFFFTSTAKLA